MKGYSPLIELAPPTILEEASEKFPLTSRLSSKTSHFNVLLSLKTGV